MTKKNVLGNLLQTTKKESAKPFRAPLLFYIITLDRFAIRGVVIKRVVLYFLFYKTVKRNNAVFASVDQSFINLIVWSEIRAIVFDQYGYIR